MGEIRIVGPGKTRGYPYPVCQKYLFYHMYGYQQFWMNFDFEISGVDRTYL